MRTQDMPRFQSTMAALAEMFGKQLSQALTDLYWEALKGMFIEDLQRAAGSWMKVGKHFPKPAELIERVRDMGAAAAKPPPEIPPADRKWLGLVNCMFLRYLEQRRIKDSFRGDIDLPTRRLKCLDLAEYFEACERDGDEMATEENLKAMFDKAMARIPDKSNESNWLDAQMEFQRSRKRA